MPLRCTLVGLVSVACGAPPPPVTPQPDVTPAPTDCEALRRTGTRQRAERDHAAASATFQSGLPACAAVGFHTELGLALAAHGKPAEAAPHYLVDISRGAPKRTFDGLSEILDGLPAARRTEIARLGTTKDTAIRVPEPGLEHAWIDRFACVDGRATRNGKSRVEHRDRKLDALLITCPSGGQLIVYFDVSAGDR